MNKTFLFTFGLNSFSWNLKTPRLVPAGSSLEVAWRPAPFREKIIKFSLSHDEIVAFMEKNLGHYEHPKGGTTINILFQRHFVDAPAAFLSSGRPSPPNQTEGRVQARGPCVIEPRVGVPHGGGVTQLSSITPSTLGLGYSTKLDATSTFITITTILVRYNIISRCSHLISHFSPLDPNPDEDGGYLRELDPNYILEDPPRCLVGTRQDIISGIIDWAKNDDPARIVWLHAYPGAGKSTVASTVAQLLSEAGCLGAIFAFNARTGTRSSVLWRLVSYELAQKFPECRKVVVEKLKARKPRLAHATAKEIFKEFVEQPLLNLAERPPEPLPVFVIDGLDEYSSVEGPPSQLYSCIKHLALLKLPLKLVVTSRFEDSIRGMFACFPHFPITIGTGDKADAQSNNDIHLFFEHEFKIISEDLALGETWPGSDAVNTLTARAGGIFIWAVTVVKYIAQNPVPRLQDCMQGEAFVSGDLYSLYHQILEKSFGTWREHERSTFQKFVTVISLSQLKLVQSDFQSILDSDTVDIILRGLRPVLKDNPVVQFAHRSFVDFLHGHGDSEDTAYPTKNNSRCPEGLRIHRDKLIPLLQKFTFLFARRIGESPQLSDKGNSLVPSRNQLLSPDDLAKSLFPSLWDQPREPPDPSALDNAIACQRQILDMERNVDSNMAVFLGRCLVIRFARLRHNVDIDGAILHFRQAYEQTPSDDPMKFSYYCHLFLADRIQPKGPPKALLSSSEERRTLVEPAQMTSDRRVNFAISGTNLSMGGRLIVSETKITLT
ncbi:hypothetical protein BDN71DRAFT_1418000 [Pleurotus eryngii]|uniref:Nephrocystin 3-like N-terminal domain-containing protein n=1 Tax=Pleurotus eryngii TaxID=5323 RepID=A0A9P5ZWG2_PLEER|nr:hypothetical protein BDN71DRAFT_1418000 [Pleurotus eryngii]